MAQISPNFVYGAVLAAMAGVATICAGIPCLGWPSALPGKRSNLGLAS